MTKIEWEKLNADGFEPLPGRCVVLLDPPPAKSGTIVIPDSARVHAVKASGYTGTVLAVNPKYEEDVPKGGRVISVMKDHFWSDAAFKVGDRVVLGIHADELREEVIWARNGQVEAVILF